MMQVTKVWWDGERLMAEPIDPTTIYQEPLQREPDFWESYQPEPTKPAPVREDWGPGPHEFHSLPSQPAPVQEPVMEYPDYTPGVGWRNVTPPAANRPWFGLTTEDMATCIDEPAWDLVLRKAEQILKEKNT
jgi:hypothetical protein